ncbi:src kinase-associated phosphoprotein 2 isoform X2 [Dryobates pubescens]|uniref:src kinase-associated phosphoprotein 2 isoform X2 n=1 Tax=Dryobates pubescens TaxID=118200 RepID=UPI0023B8E052|nr:src kinase-associated phosphoprotein 2 isoform X2 [Dryobates pubescens]
MNNSLRKDSKKDCCFEIFAADKRIYQFTAATPKEAEEWVQQIKFVIQDMESNTIPEEEVEEEEYDDVGQVSSDSVDDSIYEEVKECCWEYRVKFQAVVCKCSSNLSFPAGTGGKGQICGNYWRIIKARVLLLGFEDLFPQNGWI